MKFFILPYKAASESARLLATKLGAKRIKLENSNFVPGPNKTVINWGNSHCDLPALNAKVDVALNKLECFKALKAAGVSIPEFTEDPVEVVWERTLARQTVTGSGGKGIVLFAAGDTIPPAPLYVRYIPKDWEFRVHVFQEKAIHVQKKKRKNDAEPNPIRSHSNGYVFAVNDVNCPDIVIDQAVAAVLALGLHFGAVDIIYTKKNQKAYVLEVNTAPGLCDTTANIYANAIKEAV